MAKLTLHLDSRVVSRARRYAKQRGVSVSTLVETYLAAVSDPQFRRMNEAPPILRSLRGILKKADIEDYKKHRAAKFQ